MIVTSNNIHIEDSYLVSKWEFENKLEMIKGQYPDCQVFKRSNISLCFEWSAHNLLYDLGIARERTKDVDLNYPQTWKEKIGYSILGCIGWIFID